MKANQEIRKIKKDHLDQTQSIHSRISNSRAASQERNSKMMNHWKKIKKEMIVSTRFHLETLQVMKKFKDKPKNCIKCF
jgi:hypothetical protein